MTIKEIEVLSGMTRANIRFYESEGLLSPKRAENGYRDYSEEDLDELKRIKLLRELGISLEEIKQLHSGAKDLQLALKNHIEKLEQEKSSLETSQKVCKIMNEDGVSYETLNAQRYLDKLNQSSKAAATQASFEFSEDVLPRVNAPWRRCFARCLDMAVYSVMISLIFFLCFNVRLSNSSFWSIVDTILTLILMWIAEPILLSVFGTTFGKWILGLYVLDYEGNKLSYKTAAERTFSVCWHGLGFCIPFLQYWKMWKSYSACSDGKLLIWENESELVLRDTKVWRGIAYIGSYVVIFFVLTVLLLSEQVPKHRGSLSTEQFCENYNQLAEYYGIETGEMLDESGKWIIGQDINEILFTDSFSGAPGFVIIEDDGEVVQVSFCLEKTNNSEWVYTYNNYKMLAALAYMGAQKEISLFSDERNEIIRCIEEHSYESFELTKENIKMTCDITFSGYMDAEICLIPEEGEDNYYRMEFKLEKVK